MTSRFPLTMNDESVVAIAGDLGWQNGWLMAKAKPRPAPPVQMQDLTAFVVKAGPPASQVAAGAPTNLPVAAPAARVAPPVPAPPNHVQRNMIVRSPAVAWLTTADNM